MAWLRLHCSYRDIGLDIRFLILAWVNDNYGYVQTVQLINSPIS